MGKKKRRRLVSVVRGFVIATVVCVLAVGAMAATVALADSSTTTTVDDQYSCNSGRGNGSEGDSSQLVDPHAGETGPGVSPTVDCDPGNSGPNDSGGD
jgi:hypothetical protein